MVKAVDKLYIPMQMWLFYYGNVGIVNEGSVETLLNSCFTNPFTFLLVGGKA